MKRALILLMVLSSCAWADTFAHSFQKVGQKIDNLQDHGEKLQKQADQELETAYTDLKKQSQDLQKQVTPWKKRLASACEDIGQGFQKAWQDIKGE